MNPKAIYYALSRMLLPTLTIMILGLMWSLSPTKTFGFLLSENSWAGFLRIVLMIAEICWFYYLYTSFLDNEELNKEIDKFETGYELDTYNMREKVDSYISRDNRNKIKLVHLPEKNCFIIRYIPK